LKGRRIEGEKGKKLVGWVVVVGRRREQQRRRG
jgi:hypothetical protein